MKVTCTECGIHVGEILGTFQHPPIKSICKQCLQKQESRWPTQVVVYLHADKGEVRAKGEELGLQGEALERFSYALGEVTVTLDVAKNGSYTVMDVKE